MMPLDATNPEAIWASGSGTIESVADVDIPNDKTTPRENQAVFAGAER
jgi:hypothetical protein